MVTENLDRDIKMLREGSENIPVSEPERQYYFIEKAKQYVKAKEEELGRPLTANITTFGCQMNPATMTA